MNTVVRKASLRSTLISSAYCMLSIASAVSPVTLLAQTKRFIIVDRRVMSSADRKKVVMAGDASVGKTCLVAAVLGEAFDPEYRPTVMDDRAAAFATRNKDGKNVEVQVMRFRDQHEFHES